MNEKVKSYSATCAKQVLTIRKR